MIEQQTDEWRQERCGKVTASRISDMLAKTKTGWGASRGNYMAELVAERLTGRPTEGFQSAAMRRGTELEPDAADAYEFRTGLDLQPVGFVPHPTIAMAGSSPDRLVGADGLAEIKVPNTATHIETLLKGNIDAGYLKQMDFQMACTGRQWCDFVSFCPDLPPRMQLFIKRIHRNAGTIGEIERETVVFLSEVEAQVAALTAKYGAE